MSKKVIIISAPSGTGKSTVINKLIREAPHLRLSFSISATSRAPRGKEKDGCEYYFLSEKEFRERIARNDFLEYEEVYPGRFYGTLKNEVDRIDSEGNVAIFDVDVVGGLNIKRFYDKDALAIFIMPPSMQALRQRLVSRNTDSPEVIKERLDKAEQEMAMAGDFDCRIVNDDLEECFSQVRRVIEFFLKSR